MTFPTISAGTRANEAVGEYDDFVEYLNALAAGVDANAASLAGLGTAATKDTGTGAANVILGNDSRLTDTRTPTDNTVSTAKIVDGAVTDAKLASKKAPRTALWLPGSAGNHATIPTSAALEITGDIDIRWFGALADWTTTGVYPTLIGKYSTAQHAYMLGMNDHYPYLEWDPDNAGGGTSRTATVAPTVADGAFIGIRVTLDVDTGASTHEVKFYTSTDDGTTWTQLGTTLATAGTTSIHPGTSPLYIGSHANNNYQMTGMVRRVEIRDGINGTIVAAPDFTAPMGPQMRDAQGNICTINGSAWAWGLAA